MALLLEEGVGMSLHAAREESDMFLMADMLSCSPTTCAGVFLISGFLILSLLVVGEEPEVSLMIVPDDDEAAVHVGGGATGEAEEGEASVEDSAGFEDEAIDAFETAVAGEQTPTFETFKSRNRIRMGFVMTFNVQKMKRIIVELFKSLNIAH